LSKKDGFKVFGEVYLREHSMEVELPFLQKTVAQFKLVPLIVGMIDQKKIKKIVVALREIVDKNTLVVVSSDFVHHGKNYGYEKFTEDIVDNVRQLDSKVVHAIVAQSSERLGAVIQRTGATVCGHDPISILLELIKSSALGELESRLTCYYCSPQIERARTRDGGIAVSQLFADMADTGAKTGVSYVGLLFTTQKRAKLAVADRLTGYEKRTLLRLARRGIENAFVPMGKRKGDELLYPLASEGLSVSAGAFVTLKLKNGDLRGCIGTIETAEPLYKTVLGRARDAAFHDSRFSPLTESELNDVVIDITILERPVSVSSWKDIVVGKHGVILKQGFASAVFLPQVAPEQGWDRETMLRHLSLKAGLPADAWRDPRTTFRVFEGGEISE
jgi:MEMO1 family protein